MLYVSLDDWSEEIPSDDYEDTSDWLIEVEKLPEADWLKEALFLNVYWSDSPEFRDIVDKVFGEVSRLIKISNKSKSKDALKTVLLNLWVSYLMGAPVRYSKRKNNYVRNSRLKPPIPSKSLNIRYSMPIYHIGRSGRCG